MSRRALSLVGAGCVAAGAWLSAGAAGAQADPPLTPEAVKAIAQTPPSKDPRDISGVWLTAGYDPQYKPVAGSTTDFTPNSLAELKRRQAAFAAGHPVPEAPNVCRPHGVPRIMMAPYPIQIVQTPGQVTILHEVGHNLRFIYLDAKQPPHLPKTYMGHSVGRWEGDVLVVDTRGFNDRTFIDEDGKAHGERLHVIERIRKIDDGTRLEDVMTLSDPDYYVHPWTTRRTYEWRPDIHLLEYVCEENLRKPGELDTGR